MLSHKFGIMESVDQRIHDYSIQNPEEYRCISVDDEIILKFAIKLKSMPTYYHSLNRSEYGLAYYGVTLIPPDSLKYFQDALLSEKSVKHLTELNQLIALITTAIQENKYVIHFGI